LAGAAGVGYASTDTVALLMHTLVAYGVSSVLLSLAVSMSSSSGWWLMLVGEASELKA
jgi:hypothetical protein